MPRPTRLTVVETFPTATATLSPPASDDAALVPAEQAWDNALVEKRSDASYELVLARMSARLPATMGADGSSATALYQGVLVWVVIARGIPILMSPSLSSAPKAAYFVPWCGRLDGLDPTDAITGQRLFSDTFGSGT